MKCFVVFQAEDGIRDLVRSRGLGDVYKRQDMIAAIRYLVNLANKKRNFFYDDIDHLANRRIRSCLLYTSDAADERSSVDLGGRRIIKKNNRFSNLATPIILNIFLSIITIQINTRY